MDGLFRKQMAYYVDLMSPFKLLEAIWMSVSSFQDLKAIGWSRNKKLRGVSPITQQTFKVECRCVVIVVVVDFEVVETSPRWSGRNPIRRKRRRRAPTRRPGSESEDVVAAGQVLVGVVVGDVQVLNLVLSIQKLVHVRVPENGSFKYLGVFSPLLSRLLPLAQC